MSNTGSETVPKENSETAARQGWIAGHHMVLVLMQLGLLALVVHQFQLEGDAFLRLTLLAVAGFAVHANLPLRMRLPFFLVLSLAGIVLVLGAADGAWLIAVGLILIGLCHLPVSFGARVALVIGCAMLLAAMRARWLPFIWTDAVWPILGSMFMFRLVVYLHDLRHDKAPVSPVRTLSYFFMLPNVCFPLFPVVDYRAFRRGYFDGDAYQTYQIGIDWMVRGVIHLILYRFVYLHLTTTPAEVTEPVGVVRHMVTVFLLYLRVSGQFHLIVGMLYLFGFRLPETHHRYFLASSFTDFWRRINIYWKDFMMKLVFYPSYFRLRRWGDTKALVAATIIVFLVTWVLHSYQWFWLRGGFPLEPQDALFWGILGVLVVFGSLRELKRPRKRAPGREPVWSASRALRTFGTFSVICALWSLWSADSVMGWLTMWMMTDRAAAKDLWLLGGLIAVGLLVAGYAWPAADAARRDSLLLHHRPMVASTALLVAILLVGHADLYARFLPAFASTVTSLQKPALNVGDAALQHKGYYEQLNEASRMSAQLWNLQAQKPAHWVGLSQTSAHRNRADFLTGDLMPGASIVFLDQPLTVNRWGMRDRDCTLEKPPGTYRIALLGASHVMGSGVADGDTFADFLEQQLSRMNPGSPLRYEVLNFGVAGYSITEQLAMLEDRALQFKPDAVIITDSSRLKQTLVSHLLSVASKGYAIPYPGLAALMRETGVSALADDGIPVPFEFTRALLRGIGIKARMPWTEGERRLNLAADRIVVWTLEEIAKVAGKHGAVPVFLGLDNVVDPPAAEVRALRDAESAGFLVFDLFDLWQGHDKEALRIAPWDNHPNAAGSRVIAERLVALIQENRARLRLDR